MIWDMHGVWYGVCRYGRAVTIKGAFVCPDNGRYVAIMAANSIMAVIDNGRAFGWDNGQ